MFLWKSVCISTPQQGIKRSMTSTTLFSHGFVPWQLKSQGKALSFIPYRRETCAEASCITSMSCFHLTPSHSFSSSLSTAFPASYKHFKTCLSFRHQVHSNARIGWGYQQEVSNPAPDGWESLAAPNSVGGRGVTAWHGYEEIFFCSAAHLSHHLQSC